MTQPRSMMHLRVATIEDAGLVADLESAVTPEDPRDGELIAFWWTHEPGVERSIRWLAERDGAAVLYFSARHGEWKEGERRVGAIRGRIHPDVWSEAADVAGGQRAQGWVRGDG